MAERIAFAAIRRIADNSHPMRIAAGQPAQAFRRVVRATIADKDYFPFSRHLAEEIPDLAPGPVDKPAGVISGEDQTRKGTVPSAVAPVHSSPLVEVPLGSGEPCVPGYRLIPS